MMDFILSYPTFYKFITMHNNRETRLPRVYQHCVSIRPVYIESNVCVVKEAVMCSFEY